MLRTNTTRLFAATFCIVGALTAGCRQSSPSSPSADISAPPVPLPAAAPVVNGLRISNISPDIGSTDGQTRVLIYGEGFEPGAIVTLDDAATNVMVLSSTSITATTPVHPTARVDVVVTNPTGQSGRLRGGYAYAAVVQGPQPSITAVSPNTGTVGGGGEITITGFNFQPGAIVRLNDTALKTFSYGSSSTTLYAQVPAHAPATVDLIVINPDGRSATLGRGYRYLAPGTLDFNGRWKGMADDLRDDHGGTEIRFTIENNTLINLTCNGGLELTMSASASISNDEFSLVTDGGQLMSGRFEAEQSAVGRIKFPPCGPSWVAHKQP
jgi:hypothetical protein